MGIEKEIEKIMGEKYYSGIPKITQIMRLITERDEQLKEKIIYTFNQHYATNTKEEVDKIFKSVDEGELK